MCLKMVLQHQACAFSSPDLFVQHSFKQLFTEKKKVDTGDREKQERCLLRLACTLVRRERIKWIGFNFRWWVMRGFPGGTDGKEPACNAGDLGSIPRLARSSREGNGTSFQYSCLENPIDRGAWWATVHGVAELDMTEWLTHTHHEWWELWSFWSKIR